MIFTSWLDTTNSFTLTSWLFLRLLGLVYLFAFGSLALQVIGLIGENGILPARNFLEAVEKRAGGEGYYRYPTLCWLNRSDLFLKLLCFAGIFLSVLLITGTQTTPVLFFLWLLYLSLVTVSREFLSYQWDALLLETGFLSIFLVPLSIFPTAGNPSPSIISVWLFRWLIFRLIFESGVVKLASGDPTWRNLTAMQYHYETQPLPTPIAWYLHKQPVFFAKISTLFTLFVELVVPFSIFAPAPVRLWGAALMILLQIFIILTGNYAFFNYLTIFLCVFLFDDAFFKKLIPGPIVHAFASHVVTLPIMNQFLIVIIGLLIFAVSIVQLISLFTGNRRIYRKLLPFLSVIEPFRIVNTYGLFAVMTVRRPEIIVEGSNDGNTWAVYEFKYKPGNVKRPPVFVAPYQPRLDWQMWFAALEWPEIPGWFVNFMSCLLEGEPEVLGLLAKNPFPGSPPKYVRALLYDYHFTDTSVRKQGGAYWRRTFIGLYLPPIMIMKEDS
jgi:lipase maturation factor 1